MHDQSKRLFRLLRLPFANIAADLGVGYDTVKDWSSGRVDTTPEHRKALAAFVRDHAAELNRFADELDAT